MDIDRPIKDDDLHKQAKAAMQMIQVILQDFPPRWQLAILKSLGIRLVIIGDQPLEPPQQPTLSA